MKYSIDTSAERQYDGRDREDEIVRDYSALPPIKRIERWYEMTSGISMGRSMALLGASLRDWAIEEQAKGDASSQSPPAKE